MRNYLKQTLEQTTFSGKIRIRILVIQTTRTCSGTKTQDLREVTESQLQELDREAMLTEINRLTAMRALARKPLQELEREEERDPRIEQPRN